jgi:putative phage-type endonuclease
LQVYNFEQGTDEWFSVRLGKITGSGFHNLLSNSKSGVGLSKTALTYAYQLIAERLTGCRDEFGGNKYTEWGNENEALAREFYEAETFNPVGQVGFVEKNEWCGCSPDGLVGEDGMIEIKCPSTKKFVEIIYTGDIPDNWIAQMLFNMWVCEREWCDFVLFDPRMKDRKIWIKRIDQDSRWVNLIAESFIASVKEMMNELP